MCHPGFGFVVPVLLVTVQCFVSGDRLENVHNAPATASFSGGHNSLLSLPLPTISEYKNLYKGSTGSYPTSSPLLHKAHYTPSTYNPSSAAHFDIVPIVKHASEPNNGDGSYSFSYETANGISASEYGIYKPGLTNDEGIQSAAGSYSYTGPDNVIYTITYTAGVEGFVPQGAHIPTPPPIPEAIQKILQFSGESSKYGHQFEDLSASNKYTSAVPTPYAGYNANYNRITSARGTEYKVLDESRK